jgi:hypothetical protein
MGMDKIMKQMKKFDLENRAKIVIFGKWQIMTLN